MEYTEAVGKIEQQIEEALKEDKRLVLVIEGKSGSGKTTLAEKLAQKYTANLYHMDDFFLQPAQRTPERLAETGGNVDYERFKSEVVIPLEADEEFSYGIYDCRQQRIVREEKAGRTWLHIIEGAYSMHPYFGKYYDLSVCIDMDEVLQTERIRARNGEQMLERFRREWIPRENVYFAQFQIMERADICTVVHF